MTKMKAVDLESLPEPIKKMVIEKISHMAKLRREIVSVYQQGRDIGPTDWESIYVFFGGCLQTLMDLHISQAMTLTNTLIRVTKRPPPKEYIEFLEKDVLQYTTLLQLITSHFAVANTAKEGEAHVHLDRVIQYCDNAQDEYILQAMPIQVNPLEELKKLLKEQFGIEVVIEKKETDDGSSRRAGGHAQQAGSGDKESSTRSRQAKKKKSSNRRKGNPRL